jgi:superfamily I DNA/RNA helicase
MTETNPLIDAINKHWDEPQSVIRVVGLAGVGKTYALAEAMSYVHNTKGTPLTRIAFVSFTRAAIQEIRHKLKAILKKANSARISPGRSSSFATAQISTIHSWCWQHLLQDSKEYIKSVGFYSPEQYGMERGLDEELSKSMSRYFSLKALGQHEEAESKMLEHLKAGALMYHIEEYATQKGERIDYNDVLAMALQAEAYDKPIDLLLVDESQDLTEMQWDIILKHLYPNARVTVVAGDLTQSIYLWNGAVPDLWMGSTVDTEIFMDESRRIPTDLLPLVNSCIPDEQYWIRTHPSNRNTGRIRVSSELEVLEYLHEKSLKNEEALVLTLSNFFVRMISNIFIQNGILFSRSDSYGREGFSQIITLQDWSALKLYGAMMQGDLSMEFFKADVGRMLRQV